MVFLGSGTFKKLVQNMGFKKQGAKNKAIVFKKRMGQAASSLFK